MSKETFESLMPVINPNLDEIVVEGKNEPLQEINPTRPKPSNTDIFQKKENIKLSVGGKKKPKSQVDTSVKSGNITEDRKVDIVKDEKQGKDFRKAEKKSTKNMKQSTKGKRNYDHLKKAREKALANRKAKAEEKKLLRQAEKDKKEALKEEKRKLRIEKNRQRARENYHKKKDLKKEEKEEIIEKIETIENPVVKKKVEKSIINGSMTYEKFARFMNMYEREKQSINQSIKQTETKPIPIPKKKKAVKVVNRHISKHPPNYFNPNRRYKQDINDLFTL